MWLNQSIVTIRTSFFLACIMMFCAGSTEQQSTSGVPLRVLTYNVRYDSMPDNISVKETIDSLPKAIPKEPVQYYAGTSEKPWSTRRIHVANDIMLRSVDVVGGQELLRRQVLDLEELLGDNFAWIGVGRDNGEQEGEYSAIFYNKKTVQFEDCDTFWLTNTPFDVSKYPGAGSKRIATTAHFVGTGGPFIMINTHLDDQSAAQRRLGASLILHRAKFEAITTGHPVIITGDFNSPSSDGAYQIITGILEPEPLNKTFTEKYSWKTQANHDFERFACKDLLGETPPQRRSGNYATFTDFRPVDNFADFRRIDYIFGGSNGGWTVESYQVGTNLYDDGLYASDHRPVYAGLRIGGYIKMTQQ